MTAWYRYMPPCTLCIAIPTRVGTYYNNTHRTDTCNIYLIFDIYYNMTILWIAYSSTGIAHESVRGKMSESTIIEFVQKQFLMTCYTSIMCHYLHKY